MQFYWFWPFARHEEIDWAKATLRPGERMVIQVIDRVEAPEPGTDRGVTVLRNLPDVDRGVGGARWLASRASTYRRRALVRKATLKSEPFDLVHLHYTNRFTDAFSSLPHPLVMSVHDVVPHVPRLGNWAEQRLLARLYQRPDALVVHHPRLADALMSQFGVESNRIHVVPHQVFPVDQPPEIPPPGPPLILFFGALRPNKGLETVASTLPILKDLEFSLTIAGRGEPNLEQFVRELAQEDERVSAEIGFAALERKRELFGRASVVVLPYSEFSSQSGVLHDAYGHGRPVVVTDVGALGAAVREDGTGVVVPPNDPVALAAGIRAALQPAAWREFSAAARRIAEQRSPAVIGQRLREVYDLLLA
jgi:glycosyltransferase involved in cell wall biosynthesis